MMLHTASIWYGLAVLTVLTFLAKLYRVRQDPLSQIPGPVVARWTGLVSKYHLLTGNKPRYVHALHQKYGSVVRVSPDEVAISDVEAAKEIHKVGQRYIKSGFYTHIGHRSAKTLFSTTDPQSHAVRRRLLQNVMSDASIRQYEPTVMDRVRLCMSRMADESRGRGAIDVFKWWTFFATDTIGELSFGRSFRMLEHGEKSQYTHDLEIMASLMVIRTTFPFLSSVAQYVPLPLFKTAAESGKRMAGYAAQSIERYKKYLASSGDEAAPMLFARILSSAEEKGLSEAQLRLEAGGYIVAGSDTTAITLTYLTWAVCQRPLVRDRLVQEIARLPENFEDEDLRSLPFLNCVIEETLRLYPAAPGALPRAVPAGGARLANYDFPGGTTVSTQAYTLHRNPEIFPNPNEFDPDRWTDPTKDMKASLMPFGGGSRVCIGMHLARMEMRLATAHFFRTFPRARVSAAEGMSDDDMVQKMYFMVSPTGHRCLIDGGVASSVSGSSEKG